jgi:hypothetical protein
MRYIVGMGTPMDCLANPIICRGGSRIARSVGTAGPCTRCHLCSPAREDTLILRNGGTACRIGRASVGNVILWVMYFLHDSLDDLELLLVRKRLASLGNQHPVSGTNFEVREATRAFRDKHWNSGSPIASPVNLPKPDHLEARPHHPLAAALPEAHAHTRQRPQRRPRQGPG